MMRGIIKFYLREMNNYEDNMAIQNEIFTVVLFADIAEKERWFDEDV